MVWWSWAGGREAVWLQLTSPSSQPQQLNAVIAASMSIKSSDKLRQILEVRAQGKGLGSRA